METFMREALRLWLRGARIPEVVEVLELIRTELGTRNVQLDFTTEYRIPPGGPGK
ncbi:MAG TPA: hypothetical protein VGT06_09890 [Candidatus Methylomirabilis sp.]|jgi:hypothetical protein|nr:hypothetical protein [Candidatus Methylomirabilis sp.]